MATTTNYSWTTPDDTDLVKDGAAAIRTLGSSADTTVKNLNPGTTAGDIDYYTSSTAKARIAIGTAGQVLRVNSGATAPEWATTADQTPLTTKGDLFTFDTADARLGVGADGTVLTADSNEATGLKWAAASGGDLVKTGSTSFTSVGSFSMDNVFSSTYGLYIVRVVITNATAGLFATFRYRASGTAATSSYYWNNNKITMSATPTSTLAGALNSSSIRIDQTNTDTTANRASCVYMKLFNPNATDKGKGMTWENQQGANQNWWTGSGWLYDATTQYDGFDFTQDSSGNITGRAEVYGYKL